MPTVNRTGGVNMATKGSGKQWRNSLSRAEREQLTAQADGICKKLAYRLTPAHVFDARNIRDDLYADLRLLAWQFSERWDPNKGVIWPTYFYWVASRHAAIRRFVYGSTLSATRDAYMQRKGLPERAGALEFDAMQASIIDDSTCPFELSDSYRDAHLIVHGAAERIRRKLDNRDQKVLSLILSGSLLNDDAAAVFGLTRQGLNLRKQLVMGMLEREIKRRMSE